LSKLSSDEWASWGILGPDVEFPTESGPGTVEAYTSSVEILEMERGFGDSPRTMMKNGALISGWWFQTFCIFHNIWDNPSH
jgi:hypothetical protein